MISRHYIGAYSGAPMSILAPTVAAPFEKFKEKTRFHIGTWSVRRHFALMALSALLFVVMHAVFTPTRVAQGDSQQYLALAQTLTDHNVFAYSKEEARPGALAGREPLYPALLAALSRLETAAPLLSLPGYFRGWPWGFSP